MTSCKDAIKQWEVKNAKPVAEALCVKLCYIIPPLNKMDPALKELAHVEQLALSTNQIEKIANLNGFKNLKILSLGRNNIKSLAGLEQVADTLEQLWCSYCSIEKLKGVNCLKKVKTLYISNNKIKDWKEFDQLKDMVSLVELTFNGNPLAETFGSTEEYQKAIQEHLPKLKKLDGVPLVSLDSDEEE